MPLRHIGWDPTSTQGSATCRWERVVMCFFFSIWTLRVTKIERPRDAQVLVIYTVYTGNPFHLRVPVFFPDQWPFGIFVPFQILLERCRTWDDSRRDQLYLWSLDHRMIGMRVTNRGYNTWGKILEWFMVIYHLAWVWNTQLLDRKLEGWDWKCRFDEAK